MRRLIAVASLILAQGVVRADAPPQQAEGRAIRGFDKFQEWAQLVWMHAPGDLDEPARLVNSWPQSDLAAVKADVWAIASLVNSGAGLVQYTGFEELLRPQAMARPRSPPRTIKADDVPDLIRLPRDSATGRYDPAEIARFMKRAAMLHTDVVMLAPPPDAAPPPRTAAELQATTRRIVDGQDTGWDPKPIHWEISRAALDAVRPAPGSDPVVASWYRATSAYLLFRREYGYLTPHLTRARALFPKEAFVALYLGVLHESYAAPAVQVALSALSSRTFRPDARSAEEELRKAEEFYQRALDLDSGLGSARLRHGRVLGLLGRRDQAVRELRQALSSLTDPRQRYYAELFLGAEEQNAGRLDQAKAAFERAGTLFPQAQAPPIALGQLAWQSADRTGAQAAFDALSRLPADQARREDPWWTYEVSAVLDVAGLIERMRQLAVEDLQR